MSDEGGAALHWLRERCAYVHGAPGHTLEELVCFPQERVRVFLVNGRRVVAALVRDGVFGWFEQHRRVFGPGVWLGDASVRVLIIEGVPRDYLYRLRDARSCALLLDALMDFAFGVYHIRIPHYMDPPRPPPAMLMGWSAPAVTP